MKAEYFDIAVVIPLEDEIIPFLEVFPSLEDRSTPASFCHVVDSGIAGISIIVVQQQEMGRTAAAEAAGLLLTHYNLGLMICLGIAGSLSKDMNLGDVCYSGRIIDVLDNTKVVDNSDDENDTELSPTHYKTPIEFTTAWNFVRTQPSLRPRYLQWQEERATVAKALVPNTFSTPNGDLDLGRPATKGGCIACGAVSKSEIYNKKLRRLERAMLAIETESGGVFAQASIHGKPAMTIRGISDYADRNKSALEANSKGAIRTLAAGNAATFLRLQLENSYFLEALANSRAEIATTLQKTQETSESDGLPKVIQEIQNEIDGSLRKLSPEYRLLPRGYRLPLPQIRQIQDGDGITVKSSFEPVEVREAIATCDHAIINLPSTYPDQSLSWVLADDLLMSEIGNRQIVPVVIDGEAFRGKQSTFSSGTPIKYRCLDQNHGVQIVFVVENIPFGSKHRLDALISEINRYAGSKFIFLVRGKSDLVTETDFANQVGATQFKICPISFIEIAHFIQKNFEMTGAESEVIALRLRDTFNRFALDAYPSYFAGIPKQTLQTLLQANRRSELIQLAVDGFLMFVVADDKSNVALNRTTRARFLRKLVLQMKVEKAVLNEEALIRHVSEFAIKHDFEIDPLSFVQGFINHGIIHFESARAHISLPFIESYLLAVELSHDTESAKVYFDLYDEKFDYTTFDLYAEIGASDVIINKVRDALRESMASLSGEPGQQHVLLGDSLSPAYLRNRERATVLQNRLTSAQQSVRDGTDKTSEKQQLLALSGRVREEAGRKQQVKSSESNVQGESSDERQRQVGTLARHWVIATFLLGSGSEHLEADLKRALSSDIVNGASLLIHEWISIQQTNDFEAIRSDLTSDISLSELPGPEDTKEKKRTISSIVDVLEFNTLAYPAMKVLNFLCEQARQRVLTPSVEGAKWNSPVEQIVHGIWLADIDASRGRKPLQSAIRDLPTSPFFCLILAGHLLSRVYWNHSQKSERLILLDAADAALKSIDLSVNKPEIKRMLERESKKKDEGLGDE